MEGRGSMTTNEPAFRDVNPMKLFAKWWFPPDAGPPKRTQIDHLVRRLFQRTGTLQHRNDAARVLSRSSGWKLHILRLYFNRNADKSRQARYSQLELTAAFPPTCWSSISRRTGTMATGRQHSQDGGSEAHEPVVAWPLMPAVDLVMLRQRDDLFPVETKKQILKNTRSVMAPDGYLFLGTAETRLNLDASYSCESYKNVSYYRPLVDVINSPIKEIQYHPILRLWMTSSKNSNRK